MTCSLCDKTVWAKGLCRNHYSAQWRANHPEATKRIARTHRERHPEQIKREKAQYYAANKAAVLATNRANALNNADAYKATRLEYSRAHRAENSARCKAWKADNRPRVNVNNARRRANKVNAPINDFVIAQWRELLVQFDNCCAYCGRNDQTLTQDHVVPLSGGGSHTMANIVPCCKSCNSRKGTQSAEDYMALLSNERVAA